MHGDTTKALLVTLLLIPLLFAAVYIVPVQRFVRALLISPEQSHEARVELPTAE